MSERKTEGYDISAVEQWVAESVSELTPPFEWERLEGGHSNLTYRLQDQAGKLAVIRRPPKGELLPKAHDMSREWALISSLGATGFPPRSALAARYAERTGRSLEKLDYYRGFNYWKRAVIVHGVYARYMAGQKSMEGVDLDGLLQTIDTSLSSAQQAVDRLEY